MGAAGGDNLGSGPHFFTTKDAEDHRGCTKGVSGDVTLRAPWWVSVFSVVKNRNAWTWFVTGDFTARSADRSIA